MGLKTLESKAQKKLNRIKRFQGFKTRCSVAERSVCSRIQGGKLSEFREKRNEFFTPPLTKVLRGEPKAKLLGTFSLVRFFGVSKEMNGKLKEFLDSSLCRSDNLLQKK